MFRIQIYIHAFGVGNQNLKGSANPKLLLPVSKSTLISANQKVTLTPAGPINQYLAFIRHPEPPVNTGICGDVVADLL